MHMHNNNLIFHDSTALWGHQRTSRPNVAQRSRIKLYDRSSHEGIMPSSKPSPAASGCQLSQRRSKRARDNQFHHVRSRTLLLCCWQRGTLHAQPARSSTGWLSSPLAAHSQRPICEESDDYCWLRALLTHRGWPELRRMYCHM